VANAPWAKNNDESRMAYINEVKAEEDKMKVADQEPSKINMDPDQYRTYLTALQE
jgi:hypothetical protein